MPPAEGLVPPKVYAVSDVHTDYRENLEWVRALCARGRYKHDCVIVAGDLSDDLGTLRETLQAFTEAFRHVFFCPGNHDLWVRSEEAADLHSLHKLALVQEVCRELGVHTAPRLVGGGGGAGGSGVWVVPVLSWYHTCFDTEPDLGDSPPVHQVMADFRCCRWPAPLDPLTTSLAAHFDSLNEPVWAGAGFSAREARARGEAVISYSHFLPRLELCPEKRFLRYANLPKAVGSDFLGRRVEGLAPDVHVFGHTHFGWDAVVGGVRYVQAALAYPAERQRRWRSLEIGELHTEPVLVYDCATGGFASHTANWSEYYASNERDPSCTDPPPWAVRGGSASERRRAAG